MSFRWKEQTVPMTSLHCLNIAIKKVGRWQREPEELQAQNASIEKLNRAQTSDERVAALSELVGSLRDQAQRGRLPQTLSVEVEGKPLALTLQGGRYTISGYDNPIQKEMARAALNKLSQAYEEAVSSLMSQLAAAEKKLQEAASDAASVREFELQRDRLQAEKHALEAARENLKKTRIEEIKTKAKALGYSIREIKIGNAVQLNLVRRV